MNLKKFITCAVLVVAALVCSASTARATYMITFHETGFADKTFTFGVAAMPDKVDASTATTNVISVNTSFGDFVIQGNFATSNAKSGLDPAVLTVTDASFRNGAAGSKTLTVTVSDNTFTAPAVSPVLMSSQLSTTSLTNAGDSAQFQSFLNGSGGTILSLGTAPSGAGPTTDIKTKGAGAYTLSNVTTLNISANGLIQSTATTTVTTPVPAGLVLALSGMPILSLGYWLRRRQVRLTTVA